MVLCGAVDEAQVRAKSRCSIHIRDLNGERERGGKCRDGARASYATRVTRPGY